MTVQAKFERNDMETNFDYVQISHFSDMSTLFFEVGSVFFLSVNLDTMLQCCQTALHGKFVKKI